MAKRKSKWSKDPARARARRWSLEVIKERIGLKDDFEAIDYALECFAGGIANHPQAPFVIMRPDTFVRMQDYAKTCGGEAVAEKLTGDKCAVTWAEDDPFDPVIDNAAARPSAEERHLRPHEIHAVQ